MLLGSLLPATLLRRRKGKDAAPWSAIGTLASMAI
jgi:hypothetical protein